MSSADDDHRFAKLQRLPQYERTVDANRRYLDAVTDEARGSAGSRWALSCLPFKGRRLSTLSMKGMETFVVFPAQDGTDDIVWFANVARQALLGPDGSLSDAEQRMPQLEFDETGGYRDSREDHLRISGDGQDLAAAFADPQVQRAARALAERLMQHQTSYARYHSHRLAEAVLGTADPRGLPGVAYRDRAEDAQPAAPTPPGPIDPDDIGAGLRAHNRLQNRLAAAATDAGWDPLGPDAAGPAFDLAWDAAGDFAVVEVKSLTEDNAVRQLRTGIGQILDYASTLRHSGLRVRACLYVEREPPDPRWTELAADAGIALAWPGAESRLGL